MLNLSFYALVMLSLSIGVFCGPMQLAIFNTRCSWLFIILALLLQESPKKNICTPLDHCRPCTTRDGWPIPISTNPLTSTLPPWNSTLWLVQRVCHVYGPVGLVQIIDIVHEHHLHYVLSVRISSCDINVNFSHFCWSWNSTQVYRTLRFLPRFPRIIWKVSSQSIVRNLCYIFSASLPLDPSYYKHTIHTLSS